MRVSSPYSVGTGSALSEVLSPTVVRRARGGRDWNSVFLQRQVVLRWNAHGRVGWVQAHTCAWFNGRLRQAVG